MKINPSLWLVMLVAVFSVGCTQMKRAYEPNLRGNWVLDHRELPNGTRVSAPQIGGFMTFTNDTRNFNVWWLENGKMVSISSIASYRFADGKYYEDCTFYAARLPAGTGPAYQTDPMSGSSAYTREGGVTTIPLPLHGEPTLTLSSQGLKATREGAFVDYWRKVY